MKVLIDRSFEKDVQKIGDKKTLVAIADCIEEIQAARRLSDLTNCKKLAGYKNAYRVKLGEYRIGFVFADKTVELIRFLHRSKIYDFFPN